MVDLELHGIVELQQNAGCMAGADPGLWKRGGPINKFSTGGAYGEMAHT